MTTPIADFVKNYIAGQTVRMHMPGHKGRKHLGPEPYDITEVRGADVLYHADGIIAESEANAARLFGTAKTVYSTEGSSLCIRAMLMLVCMLARTKGKNRACIAAGRNAHRTFITAAGLMDIDVRWMYAGGVSVVDNAGNDARADIKTDVSKDTGRNICIGENFNADACTVDLLNEGIVSCKLSAETIERYITDSAPDAVYITSPDYLGNMADIAAIAEVCHKHGCLLMVDNAHGAYLAFEKVSTTGENRPVSHEQLLTEPELKSDLDENLETINVTHSKVQTRHPIALGADMCCDSAHKTLPVLTGGAYLHIAESAPLVCRRAAEQAMGMFATTSPSYLIMQSLDLANKQLSETFAVQLEALKGKTIRLKRRLREAGWELKGDESIKLTLAPKSYGYTGDELADILREHNIEPEFADPDYLVLMFSTDTSDSDIEKLTEALLSVKRRPEISAAAPIIKPGTVAMSIHDALLSDFDTVSVRQAAGRILAEPGVTCPPAVPIAICGELIDDNAIACFRYYGIESVRVVKA